MSLAFTSTHRYLFLFLGVVAILYGHAHGRFLIHDLVSDGGSVLRLPSSFAVESTCEQTYGFLPCTTTILGNLFLILIYGFLMYKAATCLSNGSELLLEILGPGIVGGLFLPILGALPDAMLILGNNNYLIFLFLFFENWNFCDWALLKWFVSVTNFLSLELELCWVLIANIFVL